MRAAARLLVCAVLLAGHALAQDEESSPLLALARDTLKEKSDPDKDEPLPAGDRAVRSVTHEIAQANVPSDAECARSLGARRFAELHEKLGAARVAIGDFEGAAQALRSACACRPRSGELSGKLAGALFAQRDYEGARAAVQRGLDLDPRSPDLNRQSGFLDFVAGRWPDAVARFKYVAAGDPSRVQSERAQLMYWLAQKRAGVAQPEFVSRFYEGGWPRPLMRHLAGEVSEANLVRAVNAERDYSSEDEFEYGASSEYVKRRRLVQALFYVGEAHAARGDAALAREYLAAAINLRTVDLTEYQLARAEIARLR